MGILAIVVLVAVIAGLTLSARPTSPAWRVPSSIAAFAPWRASAEFRMTAPRLGGGKVTRRSCRSDDRTYERG
ncbi:MAG TPA: hypothetical protein VKI44_01385 [Acetobacteraceae bacterium]|nr:hypothetical protein [Acetobacteraceae bacterium]